MVDSIVGSWRGRSEDTKGMEEFHIAVGHPEANAKIAEFNVPYTFKIKKVDDLFFKSEFEFVGLGNPITKEVHIGQKNSSSCPGIGDMEMDMKLEGHKIVGVGTAEGKEISFFLYAEGSRLTWGYKVNGVTVFGQADKE